MNPYPEESVAEDIGEGVAIVQVFTTDEDTEVNSGVMYRIVQGNIGGVFTVDAEGVISRGPTPLDRETLDFYLLVVEAFDPSAPSLPTDTAVVTIQITDVNDVVPEFVQSIYSRLDLTEDVEIGTRVINVQAQDMDLLAAGMVRYSIIAGDDQGFFDIDATTGEIRTSSEFPSISETMTFNLTVQARDQSAPFNVGTAYVVVNILDAGEIPPVFVLPRYEADSIENLGPGTFVVQVQALVENRPANLRYSLDPNAHPDVMMHFIVNETTGEIIIRSPLDREDNDFFAFTVFAEGETISSSTAVWVTVLDANDNAPTFIEFPEDVTIMEGSPAQTVIGEIRTSDLDINQNAQINYRISDGNREGAFTLRTTTEGISLITTRPLNREFTDEYNITIIAFDSGEPVLESSQTVRISVGDINDNAPLFTTSSYSGTIFENVLSSSPVATLTVTDSDLTATNDLIFTIIQGNEEGKFTVNNRGEVTLTSSLDRETVDSYQLTVRLQDPSYDDQYQVFVPVYVTVLDQNDNSPIFAQDNYEAQVGEGLRSVIVTTVSASDRDLGVNREIRFNVTGSNSEFFTIDPIQGHLLTDTELDREALDAYIVVITATDQAADPMERLTSTTTVTVSVTDINDSPPAFTAQQYGPYSILEESTNAFIDTIQATDPDLGTGGMVTFSLIGEFRDYFRLNPSTGLLTVNPNRPLDYEEQQQINITIVARDAEGLQSTRDVTINVININDNNPRFEGAPYTFTISENVTTGTLAFIAVATDADLGPPGVVTYSIVDGNTDNVFWINPDNGEIYINKTLDRETIASYDLVIEANDNPVNPDDTRTTTTSLTITVSDADDVPPTFPSDRYLGTILENTFIGTLVSMDRPIIAVDSDEVSVIMYVIRGNESASFMIDPLSGELRSSEVFDREVKAMYTFTVIATDSQGSYAEAEVVVTVLDANDNEPVLDLSEYNYTIPEGSVPGSLVGQLTATDGDGHAVRFSIITGAEDKFIIDPETGWISVSK
ncbi:putative cadherin-23 [Apostichopus japonicus]|uniref:Putative cadherin-23 n=1 Tax=Stichopus japonicus TaxID=307972 RepID=A0A2G8LG39_STIJA|nr:putative cadherin-23 [Apostichopus japonicus]